MKEAVRKRGPGGVRHLVSAELLANSCQRRHGVEHCAVVVAFQRLGHFGRGTDYGDLPARTFNGSVCCLFLSSTMDSRAAFQRDCGDAPANRLPSNRNFGERHALRRVEHAELECGRRRGVRANAISALGDEAVLHGVDERRYSLPQ